MKNIIFKEKDFHIREAVREDAGLIFGYIKKMAQYENLTDQVVAEESDILNSIFNKNQAKVLIAEKDNEPIGFMLYFLTYSTFLGRANLYLEDIYIDEEQRHQGYGKYMFKALAKIAFKEGYYRIDWMCLDWNTKAIGFYKSLGAKHLDDWITFRLEENGIEKLGRK